MGRGGGPEWPTIKIFIKRLIAAIESGDLEKNRAYPVREMMRILNWKSRDTMTKYFESPEVEEFLMKIHPGWRLRGDLEIPNPMLGVKVEGCEPFGPLGFVRVPVLPKWVSWFQQDRPRPLENLRRFQRNRPRILRRRW